MCANYEPARGATRIYYPAEHLFGIDRIVWRAEAYPTSFAPMIRRMDTDAPAPEPEIVSAQFGLLPAFASSRAYVRQWSTHNSRSETSATLRTYAPAYKAGRRCIIPAEWIYEPRYNDEGTASTRWKIARADGRPLGIAGLWSWWPGPTKGLEGQGFLTMTMLTVNAAAHPLMRQMHRPTDEKRSVVVLEEADYDQWLGAPMVEAWDLVRLPADDLLVAEPAPRAPAPPRRPARPTPPAGDQGGLF